MRIVAFRCVLVLDMLSYARKLEAVRESAAEATAANQAARVAKATQAAHVVVAPKPVVTDSAGTAPTPAAGIGERMLAGQQVHHGTMQQFMLFQSVVLMLILWQLI